MSKKNSVFNPRYCIVCGKEYIPHNANQKCCSKECSYEHELERKRMESSLRSKRRKPHVNTMGEITEIVKNNPDYGHKVAAMEGRIIDKNLQRITEKSKETLKEVMEELRY